MMMPFQSVRQKDKFKLVIWQISVPIKIALSPGCHSSSRGRFQHGGLDHRMLAGCCGGTEQQPTTTAKDYREAITVGLSQLLRPLLSPAANSLHDSYCPFNHAPKVAAGLTRSRVFVWQLSYVTA